MPRGKEQKQPKGRGRPKAKQSKPKQTNKYNAMRDKQTQRWRKEGQVIHQNQQRIPLARIQNQIGNAVRVRLPTVGMSDLMQHRITWIAGTVYVGNGTLGATNSVYMAVPSGAQIFSAGTGGGFWIPFAPADSVVGSTYGATLMKLYRRMRLRNASVHLLTVQSSTTNNAVMSVAPCLGPPGAAEFAAVGTGTSAAQSLQNLMSISGIETGDSFENVHLDLTPYIAGGAGPRQNEFAIANSIAAAGDPGGVANALGVVGAAFQIAGNSTVSALQGTVTHNIVCSMVVDLLDFVGAVPVIDPEGAARSLVSRSSGETRENRRTRLLSELSAVAREDVEIRHRSPSKGKGEL